jgi:excisionase family DNA binding protein
MPTVQLVISASCRKRHNTGMSNIAPSETVQSYLTTKEAAALVRLHPASLEKICRQGRGPRRILIGRAVRFARAEVDAWMQSQTQGAAA